MAECSQRHHTDDSEKGFYVCSICECAPGVHLYFIHCPLLQDELICIDCCHSEVPKDDIIKTLKDITTHEQNRADIDATCKECGNRDVGKDKL